MIFDEERYILCGDQYLSIYYGDEGTLAENFLAIAMNQAIERARIDGVIEAAVTASSILIRYNPFVLAGPELISRLREMTGSIRATRGKIKINSAIITIPVLYNDRWTLECAKAHNVPPNLEIIAEFNRLSSTEEVIKIHSGTAYWVRYVAGPGLAGMIPLDQEKVLFAPKYERPRAWTPGRTLALGGNCTSYYPFEMPGGSMLLGRLPVPLFELTKSHPVFQESPSICNIGDRIKFLPITEEEYDEIEKSFQKYEYRIERDMFEFEVKGDKGV